MKVFELATLLVSNFMTFLNSARNGASLECRPSSTLAFLSFALRPVQSGN